MNKGKINIHRLNKERRWQSKFSERGIVLVEALVSIVLLAVIGVGFAGALAISSKTLITTDERETAKNIAEMEMEYIKSQSYADQLIVPSEGYGLCPMPAEYTDYSVVTAPDGKIYAQAAADHPDDHNIQKVEITVEHGNKEILTVTGYKTRW